MTANRALPANQAPTHRLLSWRPTTLREWPGHIATALRVEGCTFSCPQCSTNTLAAAREPVLDWSEVVTHLDSHREMLDGVVVTGGEPTEDPDLPSLLAALKDMDVAVRLDTNGSRPDVLWFLLTEALVDSVALDIKAVPAKYRLVSGERDMPARVMECAEMLRDAGIDHEYRTTLIPGIVDPTELPRIARSLQGGKLYALQQFVPHHGSMLQPYPEGALTLAAADCRRFLPTIVRGINIGED